MSGMESPIRQAALELGFLDAAPARADPFALWRGILDALPFGKQFSLRHDPCEVTGWPREESTVWCALFPAPAFAEWPDDCGEVGNSFFRYAEMRPAIGKWHEALRQMGYELCADPPIPERAAAIRAGLGSWSLMGPMLSRASGSYVCIATVIVHEAPPEGAPGAEMDKNAGCERCGRCACACPAQAIGPKGVDATKCLRNEMYAPNDLPERDFAKMGKRIIGCEACQRACPHNRDISLASPRAEWKELFRLETLLTRPDWEGMRREIEPYYVNPAGITMQAIIACANTGRADLVQEIAPFLQSGEACLRRAASWATERLTNNEEQ